MTEPVAGLKGQASRQSSPAGLAAFLEAMAPHQEMSQTLSWRDGDPLDADSYNRMAPHGRMGELLFGDFGKKSLKNRNLGSYDAMVTDRGVIPVIPGSVHDFFNFICWLQFPRAKASLHRLQRRFQAERALRGDKNRSSPEDRLTCFDEGGVVILDTGLGPRLPGQITEKSAQGEVFDSLKLPTRQVKIFGHAIYESLFRGIGGITAFGLIVRLGNGALSGGLDSLLEKALEAGLENQERMPFSTAYFHEIAQVAVRAGVGRAIHPFPVDPL